MSDLMVHYLQCTGNTVRYNNFNKNEVIGVLVVGGTITCHFWLNILPLCDEHSIRHFITIQDLSLLADRLHVQPKVLPCFLVLVEGYVIDWFRAPLPPPGEAVNSRQLIKLVLDTMFMYRMDR
jgi:hypothetical protein